MTAIEVVGTPPSAAEPSAAKLVASSHLERA
jgi:hypothetical protein